MNTGMGNNQVAYATDEYGRPFIIVREGKKSRIQGLEAQKVLRHFYIFTSFVACFCSLLLVLKYGWLLPNQ
jgi:hypothetical protein